MKFHVKPGVKRSILTIALLAGLAACGGGGDGGGGGGGLNTRQNGDTVPASAVASNAAFVAYADRQVYAADATFSYALRENEKARSGASLVKDARFLKNTSKKR